jgi:hypothetical protein
VEVGKTGSLSSTRDPAIAIAECIYICILKDPFLNFYTYEVKLHYPSFSCLLSVGRL